MFTHQRPSCATFFQTFTLVSVFLTHQNNGTLHPRHITGLQPVKFKSSTSDLCRFPAILNLSSKMFFGILHPLYRLPESSMHWFRIYRNNRRNELSLIAATHDPCLLYTSKCLVNCRPSSVPYGITCLQTDIILNLGNKAFFDEAILIII